MIISLDGFIAGPEGHLDWMISPDPEREAEHLQFLGSVDTILVAHGVYASRSASKGKTRSPSGHSGAGGGAWSSMRNSRKTRTAP
jgi:hypothetical protein